MSSSIKQVLVAFGLAGLAILVGSSFTAHGLKQTLTAVASAVWGS